MSKRKLALIVNAIIVVLELIVFGKNIIIDHNIAIEYYTNDSNIIALIVSLLFVILYKKDLKIIKDLRFIATCCLTVTFLTVVFVLCPMYDFNYKLFMFTDNFLILHTIVPILSVISYVVFEEKSSKNYLSILVTIIYSIILVTLNLLDKVKGPYPFLMVKEQGIALSILWGIILIGGGYLIGVLLNNISKIKGAK